MTKQDSSAQVAGWTFYDVFDTQPLPGAYVSHTPAQDFDVHVGNHVVTIHALNWNHAEHRAFEAEAERGGGDLRRCELCGAHLRYAALFFDANDFMHVVGQECANRVQAGVADREEWAIAQSIKEAKEIQTKNGLRWKLDLHEPNGFRMIAWDKRPKYASTFTPKCRVGRRLIAGKPRVTLWANNEAELLDNLRAFRAFLRENNIVVTGARHPRRY